MTIDDRLDALACSAVHPELENMGGEVFARIDAERYVTRRGRQGLLAIAGTAMLAGVASASLPAADRHEMTVGGVSARLAPSTLLGGR